MRTPGHPPFRRHALAVLVAALLLPVLAGTLGRPAAAEDGAPTLRPAPVVYVGVGGLRWDDVTRRGTPTLWELVGSSPIASISVRTARALTCPLDGWLSISEGVKATSVEIDESRSDLNPGQVSASDVPCPDLPAVTNGVVDGWDTYVDIQQTSPGAYGDPGALGDLLARSRVCATAIGSGAAVALATSAGTIADYESSWSPQAQQRCPVTVIDGGQPTATDGARAGDLAQLDSFVAGVVAAAPEGTHVIVSGNSDTTTSPTALEVAIDHTVGRTRPSWLTSDSTRHDGIVQIIDITPTLLAYAGVRDTRLERSQIDGKAWQRLAGRRGMSIAETVEDRRDLSNISTVIPTEGPVFGAWVAAVPVAILVICLIALIAKRRGARWAQSRRFTDAAIAAALFGSSLWTALYLVTVTEWWRADHPALVLGTVAVVAALAIAMISAYVRIQAVWRFVLVQAGLSFGALTIDGLIGTPLQVGSILGAGPIYGGRFYGFGNVTFTVYASSALLLAAVVAEVLIRRGERNRAVAATALIGGIAVLVDGWPSFGADFGGMLSLVPGVVLLVLLVARVRMTLLRLAVVGVTGAAAVTLVSWLDYLRGPDQRSHMGAFVARVIDGQAQEVVVNKLDALTASLTSPLGVVELAAFCVGLAMVWQPHRFKLPELALVFDEWPTLRSALFCLALTCGIGTFVNDSGALVAALAVVTTAPLLIATCAWWTTRAWWTEPATEQVPA